MLIWIGAAMYEKEERKDEGIFTEREREGQGWREGVLKGVGEV